MLRRFAQPTLKLARFIGCMFEAFSCIFIAFTFLKMFTEILSLGALIQKLDRLRGLTWVIYLNFLFKVFLCIAIWILKNQFSSRVINVSTIMIFDSAKKKVTPVKFFKNDLLQFLGDFFTLYSLCNCRLSRIYSGSNFLALTKIHSQKLYGTLSKFRVSKIFSVKVRLGTVHFGEMSQREIKTSKFISRTFASFTIITRLRLVYTTDKRRRKLTDTLFNMTFSWFLEIIYLSRSSSSLESVSLETPLDNTE